MPDKKFDLGDYIEVKDRIAIFYELYPQGRLVTGNVDVLTSPDDKQRVMVRAFAYRTPDDPLPGVGCSWMDLPGTTSYTRGSELENTETSAWGRAIASLGILIDRSIASAQEVQNKQGNGTEKRQESGAAEQRTTHRDGLIGKAIAQGVQDFQLRTETDDGVPKLPFRIKDRALSQIVLAEGPFATALDTYRDEVLGQRITVWGHYTDESYDKKNKKTDEWETIRYKVLHVERIKTPAFEMPPPMGVMPDGTTMADADEAEPTDAREAGTLFDPAESARLDAEEAAAAR